MLMYFDLFYFGFQLVSLEPDIIITSLLLLIEVCFFFTFQLVFLKRSSSPTSFGFCLIFLWGSIGESRTECQFFPALLLIYFYFCSQLLGLRPKNSKNSLTTPSVFCLIFQFQLVSLEPNINIASLLIMIFVFFFSCFPLVGLESILLPYCY